MKKELLMQRRAEIHRLARQYGASNVRVFGSVARQDDTENSDVDLLVTMQSGRSLVDVIGLTQDLEAMLQTKVDVVTDEGLSPYLADRIESEAVAI